MTTLRQKKIATVSPRFKKKHALPTNTPRPPLVNKAKQPPIPLSPRSTNKNLELVLLDLYGTIAKAPPSENSSAATDTY